MENRNWSGTATRRSASPFTAKVAKATWMQHGQVVSAPWPLRVEYFS